MTCSQCVGIEKVFNEEYVTKELRDYRRKGPPKTTRWLIEALKNAGVQGLSLLDIGGGVGAIQHALIEAGVTQVTGVDASAAYIQATREEAERRGQAGRMTQKHGDFVDLSGELDTADIVTLDRVICCYDDMQKLVGASSNLAKRYYGVVYPRDKWYVKVALVFENLFMRLSRNPYRAFVHPTQDVEAIVKDNGFQPSFFRKTAAWQVVIYTRQLN